MRANVVIAMFRTLQRERVKAELTFRDFGHYACLKLSFGKKGEHACIWSKLYKSKRLIKKMDGIPFNYSLFKKE